MAERLSGKVAVITGGASGIGAATARAFVAEGARVVIADINMPAGEALARELRQASFIRTDVTLEEQVRRAVEHGLEKFGRLDCMINNAGVVGAVGSIQVTTAEAWNATLAILLNSVFFGIKHAAKPMREQRSGSILSVSSVAGVMGGLGPHAYTTAKHAVIGLTRSAASELAPYGVRVNAVAPGTTVTPLIAEMRGGLEAAEERSATASPLGTALMPEEIAASLVYLASDEARHVTAHTLVVDSGISAAGPSGSAMFHSNPAGFLGKMPPQGR